MNSSQEDHYGMFLKTDLYLVTNATALAYNPAIATTRTALNSLINAIAQADSTATRDITGYTEAKNAHRETQLTLFKKVRAGLMGYYTGNLDPRYREIINHTDSAINDFRDAEIYIKTDQVLDIALPIKADLVPFGVTEAEVDSLDTLNDAWPALEPSGRMEEAINKASRQDVSRFIEQTVTLLDGTLDNYLKVVQYNDPNLYSQYQTARMIDDSGGGSDSNGYDVQNYIIPANGSIIINLNTSGPLPGSLEIYMRAISGGIRVCTTDLPANPCATGYELIQGVTFKGPLSNLNIDLNKTNLQFTNPGLVDVVVRAGVRSD